MCYIYDSLSRVVRKVTENLTTNSGTEDTYTYDAAGNITASEVNAEENSFDYDSGNRLDSYNETSVSYDLDGNMTSAYFDGRSNSLVYDSGNRLISCGDNSYTYNVEDVRIRNVHGGITETYAYDTNCRLSRLLVRTKGSTITKYVYGIGLIGEESSNSFRTYHFDYRGSTVAITNASGTVTDTFAYDTYGKLTDRTGTTDAIFMYNGRDGVVSDTNGLVYMRARYYSPELCRFVNADIISGYISNAVTLNRYAYANGNPVTNIDPYGLGILLTLGIMAIGGLVCAIIEGGSSIVEQSVDKGEINWDEVASDMFWGFCSGVVAASPLCIGGKVAFDAAISMGRQMTEEYIYAENKEGMAWLNDVNYVKVGLNVTVDAIFSYVDGPGANYKNQLDDHISDLWKKRKREKRRDNDKISSSRIKSIDKQLADIVIVEPILKEVIPDKNDIIHDKVSDVINSTFENEKSKTSSRK
ncbi:MAG: RHS repeat-associated core domain-containing protein [Clostridia bacterium]|nr:RHS repeat-associated core domain-containing protein [Clostridia bacterium]